MKGSTRSEDHERFEVAIIGMAGRLPGARNLEEFWHNVRGGVESITTFSEAELAAAGIAPAMLRDPRYVKAWSVLADAESFDASFFGFTPKEAELMDPQHRLFLECAWAALEDAGYETEKYHGSIGVYAGAGMNTYLIHNVQADGDLIRSAAGLQMIIGGDKDFLTTQVSYKCNLQGPSVAIQTACSTSLVAVHLACQSLLGGECDMALAGGVTLRVPQSAGYLYQEGGILSPDGHCRAFDVQARGTVCGSGVGIVVLKRLDEAVADGDSIRAVIKGTAINNDGSRKVGYTAPSLDGQTRVVVRALAMAEVSPETVSYIETHGTGTAVGDPIEIAALTQAFRSGTGKRGFCAVGSVKTNIGHLGAAAGVTGLIKTVLALMHKELPPSLYFEHPNPQIDFANSPFYVQTTLAPWRAEKGPRRAGVSAFAMGGTNAHVVLEEASPRGESGESRPWKLLVLSAKTSTALERVSTNLAAHLKKHRDLNLADVAHTLQIGRKAFRHRRMLVCRDGDDAVTALERPGVQRVGTNGQERTDRPVAFLFPGQGTQYLHMGFEVYQSESTVRDEVDRCSELLRAHLNIDLREVLYAREEGAQGAIQRLHDPAIAEPALFTIEYALARLWMAWGVRPEAMIGHGIGEYVAACLAGVLSVTDTLVLVAARAQLMQRLPRSSQTVYSEMMEPLVAPFREQVEALELRPPTIPYVSNVTGTWITAAEATSPSYWTAQVCQTVRVAECLRELLQEPDRILLEVGPGRTLISSARRHADRTNGQTMLSSLPDLDDQDSAAAFLLNSLGQLWLSGMDVDWAGFSGSERRHRVPLPTYPFERQRHWIEPDKREDHVTTQPVARDYPARAGEPAPAPDGAFVGPRTPVEVVVAAIWQDVLGMERISVHDDFFQLGGHSLLAAQVIVRLRKALEVELSPQSLFDTPTVMGLAAHIETVCWAAQSLQAAAGPTLNDREEGVV
jgi:acyl transferase domain-containing protein